MCRVKKEEQETAERLSYFKRKSEQAFRSGCRTGRETTLREILQEEVVIVFGLQPEWGECSNIVSCSEDGIN